MRISWPGTDPQASIAVTLRVGLIGAAVILILWVLYDVILMIFLAILLGAILRGISTWLSRKTGMRENPALALVTIAVFVCFAGLAYWVGPRFVHEGKQLLGQLQHWVQEFSHTALGSVLFSQFSGGKASAFALPAMNIASSAVGTLGVIFVVIVTAIYFAISPMLYVNGITLLVPISYRPRARQILVDIGHTLQWWMLGQAIDMLVVGVLSGIGLWLLGVPIALALGVIAGLFTFVPFFGTIAAGILGVLVTLTISLKMAMWTVGIFLICHTIEGYVVAPLVQRRTVDLPPALTILSISILGALYGAIGLILATPVAAAVLMLLREAYVSDVLGDRAAEPEHPPPQPGAA